MSPVFQTEVFIAYGRKDHLFVEWLVRRLKADDFHTRWDREIPPGANWPKTLRKWINDCDAAVLVLSPDSVQSDDFNDEVMAVTERARSESLHVIPIVCESVEPRDVPLRLASLQWVDFRDHSRSARTAAYKQLVNRLQSAKETPLQPARTRWHRVGLRPLLLSVVALSLAGIIGLGAARLGTSDDLPRLRRIQQSIVDLDERVRNLAAAGPPAPDTQRAYVDSRTGEHLATDVWSGGRLTWRMFFRDKQLIARDTFEFSGDTVVGKTRTHFDPQQRSFLTDRFAQNGVLIDKLDCPGGMTARCVTRVDIMSSPLPPPWLIFYR